ncbi:hypothetical protein TeGR_g8953 [Tetraparma gracilis]|uniref:Uncharacterized protein n=1 Tax=Tetraparma gracilis TaxID=2962635 RepID=A0ABQ6ND47_9STRA|nr:hypothetical protein TeGR_g8953 [Tetraparma gracilis]
MDEAEEDVSIWKVGNEVGGAQLKRYGEWLTNQSSLDDTILLASRPEFVRDIVDRTMVGGSEGWHALGVLAHLLKAGAKEHIPVDVDVLNPAAKHGVNPALMDLLVSNLGENAGAAMTLIALAERRDYHATIWHHPGFPEALVRSVTTPDHPARRTTPKQLSCFFMRLSESEDLRLPMASHPGVLEALVSVRPSDGDRLFEYASTALDNISSDTEACRIWAVRALEQNLGVPLFETRNRFQNTLGVLALASIASLAVTMNRESEKKRDHELAFAREKPLSVGFDFLCDIVVAGGDDSMSEFAMVQIAVLGYYKPDSLGPFPAEFIAALTRVEHGTYRCMPFFAPFATYIKGAAKSLCTSSNTVDAVLSELENAAAGGRQDFVRDIVHVVLMAFAFRTVPRSTSEDVLLSVVMATHPKASVLLSCYCSRIRTGDYPCSRSEILAQVARFCERNDHPTGGYRDLQSMLGAQEGLVDAVLAEIEESDDGLGILYRLLGYCAISCTDDALPRIAKAAGGSKSNLLRCGGEDMGEYISLKETVADLHALVFGAEDPLPPRATLLVVLKKLESELGYVGTGTVVERIKEVKDQVGV